MLLDNIIHYIKNELNKIHLDSLTEPLSLKCELFIGILENVLNLLNTSHHGLNTDHIDDALLYLQSIQIEEIPSSGFSLFKPSPKTVGSILKEHHPVLDTKRKCRLTAPLYVFSREEHRILGSIHIALMNFTKWKYVYPDYDKTGDISKLLAEWQLEQSRPLDSPLAAIVDYQRDILIMDEKGGDNDTILSRIQALVQQATGYQKRDKANLRAWLKSNGGQANSRFIDPLLKAGYFVSPKIQEQPPSIGIANYFTDSYWSIKAGKICYTFDMLIRSIQYGSMAIILTVGDDTKLVMGMDEIEEAFKAAPTLPVLMRIGGTVQLEMHEDSVLPTVTQFVALSYTSFLKRPDVKNPPCEEEANFSLLPKFKW